MGRKGTESIGWSCKGSNPYIAKLDAMAAKRCGSSRNRLARILLEQRLDLVDLGNSGWEPEDVKMFELIQILVRLPKEKEHHLHDLIITEAGTKKVIKALTAMRNSAGRGIKIDDFG